MTKLIVHLVLLLNFAYLALLSLQTMFCNDIKKFNKHKLFGIPLRRRLYRLWLALRFEKFRGFVYLLVSSWIYTFDYLNKLYEGKVQEENTYFLIAFAIFTSGIITALKSLGYELEVYKHIKER